MTRARSPASSTARPRAPCGTRSTPCGRRRASCARSARQEALAPEHRALEILKDLQQSTRAYVQHVGFDAPPLKVAQRRLQGDAADVPARTNVPNSLPPADLAVSGIRAALSALSESAPVSPETWQTVEPALTTAATRQPDDFLPGLQALRLLRAGGADDRPRDPRRAARPPAAPAPGAAPAHPRRRPGSRAGRFLLPGPANRGGCAPVNLLLLGRRPAGRRSLWCLGMATARPEPPGRPARRHAPRGAGARFLVPSRRRPGPRPSLRPGRRSGPPMAAPPPLLPIHRCCGSRCRTPPAPPRRTLRSSPTWAPCAAASPLSAPCESLATASTRRTCPLCPACG